MPLTIRTDPMTCAECGQAIDMGHVIVLQGLAFDAACALHRAADILSPNGTRYVSIGDVEKAVSAAHVATKMLRVQRLSQFSGRRP